MVLSKELGTHVFRQTEWAGTSPCALSQAGYGWEERALGWNGGLLCWWTRLGEIWMGQDLDCVDEWNPEPAYMPGIWEPSGQAEFQANTPPHQKTKL